MTWWKFTLLALAAFRVTRLVGWDDLTIKPRRWLTGVSDDQHVLVAEHVDAFLGSDKDPWQDKSEGYMPIGPARFYLSRMIRCPWCLGFWISGVMVLAAWRPWSWWMLPAWFAMSSVVGLVAKNLDE